MTDHIEIGLSLTEIDELRDPEERSRDGKSGDILYQLNYQKQNGEETVQGKVTEIGAITNDSQMGLEQLAEDGYTTYGIFRLTDRSTTKIVEDAHGATFKTLSLGVNNVNVAYPVNITRSDYSE